jgi:hypothetical protein
MTSIDKTLAELAELRENRRNELLDIIDQSSFSVVAFDAFPSILAHIEAQAAEMVRLTGALADAAEQISQYRETEVAVNMQELMRINNEQLARADSLAADLARMREALARIRDRQARLIMPWTHEQAADEYARMLDCDRSDARAALQKDTPND